MKYLDPKADLTFKKIFGNHPDRLKNLLNTLQSLNEDELMRQQQYLPTTEDLEISGFTDAELRAYDKFWDSVSVERTLLDDRYQKGMEEGMEKGRAEGIAEGIEEGMSQRSLEIARKMLAKGMDEASIMDMTGLTAEEIKNRKRRCRLRISPYNQGSIRHLFIVAHRPFNTPHSTFNNL